MSHENEYRIVNVEILGHIIPIKTHQNEYDLLLESIKLVKDTVNNITQQKNPIDFNSILILANLNLTRDLIAKSAQGNQQIKQLNTQLETTEVEKQQLQNKLNQAELNAITHQNEIELRNTQISDLTTKLNLVQINSEKQIIESQESQLIIERLQQKLTATYLDIEALKVTAQPNSADTQQIENLKNELNTTYHTINQLKHQLATAHAKINRLHNDVITNNAAINEKFKLQAELTQIRRETEELNNELNNKQLKIDTLGKELTITQNTVNKLNQAAKIDLNNSAEDSKIKALIDLCRSALK